jgi:pilus assembly protein Flp/PilA
MESLMLKKISAFLRDEEGVTAIEYGLIAGLLVIGLVLVLTTLGGSLKTIFTNASTALTTAAR